MATIEEQGASDDMLLNQINGAEAACVLSALPSPIEEQLVSRNKLLINARLWLGLGNLLDEMKNKKSGFQEGEVNCSGFLNKKNEKKGYYKRKMKSGTKKNG
jgi:N-acetylglucosaminyldiphosphoundecaprenol N-acetyl-beta-D-mannosaminyltransferase